MNVTLRRYQINGIDNILNAWSDCRSVLFQMPTGTGKTTLFCEIVRKFTSELYPDKKVLIVTHRKELVEQVFDRLVSGFHLTAGIISSNYIGIQSAPIQVASIQTLVRREEHQKDIYSLVIIDEAHHALANTYQKLWDYYPGSKFLGVTATPIRTNGEGFHDLFDKLVTTASVKWFIKKNYLSDIKYFASHTPDLSNIKLKAGDYDELELSEVMQHTTVMADLVQSYIDFALDKKMIIYAVNRGHCARIVEKFNSMGYFAKAIDSYTPTDARREIVEDFKNNKFKILCNVNIFTEGFDCPDVDAVQLARPTKSLALFLQQVGRCMRPHQNKQHGIILDNAGLWKEHGLPKMDRNWTLSGTDKNLCPSQKEIVGIKELSTRENNEPQENKGIRLVEIGELDGAFSTNTIDFNNIERNLTDKKIATMRERIETLIKKIQKYEQLKSNETDEEDVRIFDEQIKKFKQELSELQNKLQPQRFEQVLELIIEKCQDVIDSNEVFIDGDKDVFLNRFVEPHLKSYALKSNEEKINVNPVVKANRDDSSFEKSHNDIYRKKAAHTKLKVIFPDGEVIEENEAVETFIKTMDKFGFERVKELSVSGGISIISDKADNGLKKGFKNIRNTNLYINDNNSTDAKKRLIEKVAGMLGISVHVEIELK